jgi:uncharacterized protein YidB (DUF937 family)
MMAREQQSDDTPGDRSTGGVDAAALARAAAALLGGRQDGAPAGLAGLRTAFERAGLGDAFDSWVATGANTPITAADLERALGAESVGWLARSTGADPARVAAGLAAVLPELVNQLTPTGVLPAAGAGRTEPANHLLRRS